MKVAWLTPFTSLDGSKITAQDGAADLLLRDVAIQSLLATAQEPKAPTPEEKFHRYEIARKIHGDSECDLKTEEIALIKNLVGKFYGPLIVGQAWEILEGRKVEA